MSDELDIPYLKRQRAQLKAACTRVKNYIDQVTAVTPDVQAHLEERKEKLERFWSEYNDIQQQIESAEDDIDSLENRTAFESVFYDLSARIRVLLKPPGTSQIRGDIAPSPSTLSSAGNSVQLLQIRLPKLDLPSFSGKYEEWSAFHEIFNSVINTNNSLNDTQRFQYLKASLSGEAADIIHSLELSERNYAVAWELLRARYDNQRVIVYTHINAILNIPSLARENAVELRRMADGTAKHVRALKSLGRPTANWDDLLVFILSQKLDTISAREWQSSITGAELPTLQGFLDFLARRCLILETTGKREPSYVAHTTRSNTRNKQTSSHVATFDAKCVYCGDTHPLYFCKEFARITPEQRLAEVRKRRLCTNCMRSTDHRSNKCTSGVCKTCGGKHNTLLHLNTHVEASNKQDVKSDPSTSSTVPQSAVTAHSAVSTGNDYVILSTAIVNVSDSKGSLNPCRALLDCGSQANFISRKCLRTLNLTPQRANIAVSGINQITSVAHHTVCLKLHSRVNSFAATAKFIVTDKITEKLPITTLKRRDIKIPHNLKLADPRFHISSDIDLLVGAELFWQLLCVGNIKGSSEHPTLQKTYFGWIVAGGFQYPNNTNRVISFHVSTRDSLLHNQIQRFWEIEEPQNKTIPFSLDEQFCENHFLQNVTRDRHGRFEVKLPIKENVNIPIGESKNIALRRFYNIERRLNRDTNLKEQYSQFMIEYRELGHMKLVNERDDPDDLVTYYLPHHPVFKQSSATTKLRVVFDASCKTSSGASLNDILMVGPVIQQDLVSILTRFRTHIHVFVADIVKMYRQIRVQESQTRLQRILWRDKPTDELNTYELTTVTYGTASASYLATRCLAYLAEQRTYQFPLGAKHVLRDFYMDDILTGSDSLEETKLIQNQVVQLLREGSFELSKWASNSDELLKVVPGSINSRAVSLDKDHDARVLGVRWNSENDSFHFTVQDYDREIRITKRTLLSDIASLFDPLGLLGPVLTNAKLIIQELWQLQLDWDSSVPIHVHTRWFAFRNQLTTVNDLTIPRCVKFSGDIRKLQLHGFCDASQNAYGACIYIRSELSNGTYRTELLCSKSRVAPLKVISLPRLELCAAVLLSRLFDKVLKVTELAAVGKFLWSDSTIALSWINSCSRKWSVFVSNRVGEIQTLTAVSDWHHVSSVNNPADALSRGLNPSDLLNSDLWWHGPAFLQTDATSWPRGNIPIPSHEIPEARRVIATTCVTNSSPFDELIHKISNLDKLCRIMAYCLRFVTKPRSKPKPMTTFLNHEEITRALHTLCKIVQRKGFFLEFEALSNNKPIRASSPTLALSPFLDEFGLIRVGGRLQNANLSYDTRHPILLPRSHRITEMLIEREHVKNLHSGVQLTIAAVRQTFWPLSIRSTARKIIRNCIICFRAKPCGSEAKMGSLPSGRVTPSRPFSHCGVDYAGPLAIREGKRRNARISKTYVAIFVCFATKAVHIELVTDLTSDAFLGALKRFLARRGNVHTIHSDNGTSFVGANRQLKEVYDLLKEEETNVKIQEFLRDRKISWQFIPPYAPHFGGLWEAAVKSCKYHLHRVVGNAHLTYEELQTVLCEIEAILNSRPICPLSEDPNDFTYLTPGHFLVGEALNSLPCPDVTDIPDNRLSRWQRVEQIRQHFWRRWCREYICYLQERKRWRLNKGEQLKTGQLVLLQQPGLAPLLWQLGRVLEVHPGTDGIVRSATVKTPKGICVRPLSKLAIMPLACKG